MNWKIKLILITFIKMEIERDFENNAPASFYLHIIIFSIELMPFRWWDKGNENP